MTCDHGRETVVRTREAPSLGRKADRIALTGEVRGFPRLNRRPYGLGHGAQEHGDSGGDGRGVSEVGSKGDGKLADRDRSAGEHGGAAPKSARAEEASGQEAGL